MSNLRDALLNGLKNLPGTREFHLHVLFSSSTKHGGMHPFSLPRSRSYLQDVLILLSEQSTPDSPRIFVAAIEAPIDVDHLWIQLFARAQKQYVFPNSSEYEGKKWLNDMKLCSWWKRIYTDVSTELASRLPSTALVKLYYLIPGYTQLEAEQSLKIASSSTGNDNQNAPMWIYGHPYSQTDIPLPCPQDTGSSSSIVRNLGHYIPSFDDDPKSRFMDEIAYTTEKEGIKSPPSKKGAQQNIFPMPGKLIGPKIWTFFCELSTEVFKEFIEEVEALSRGSIK
ncbi:hypothetical protein MPER_06165 [Moniliophthora perniciosa FA553]|nr:hypothetical protein MPER_06165 [Moniliophthora perniciosa FA553]